MKISDPQTSVGTLISEAYVIKDYKLTFHEIHKLSIISIVTPVFSAGCECAFLCLRHIKTYLRDRTGHERLSDLTVLAVEQDIVKVLDIEDLI
ncbi:hypothetical protein ANN_19200 [Periplaneta americana]|uniref:HAT C-terminal dimerisation domain-containing protein n=1 Tax=Periplaneta americana TaxID=6978 RepID=A0ABQ8SA72_PERAM|nr:hypothetical protein ANN_19200 [Periplaneta americana]